MGHVDSGLPLSSLQDALEVQEVHFRSVLFSHTRIFETISRISNYVVDLIVVITPERRRCAGCKTPNPTQAGEDSSETDVGTRYGSRNKPYTLLW